MSTYLEKFSGFFIGILFAVGLGISGMTLPENVLGFLTLSPNWNPNLLGVMASALAVFFIAYRWTQKKSRPLLTESFHLPTRRDIDKKLIIGSSLFGLGWGMAGYCPGPAITSSLSGNTEPLLFCLAMLAGMKLFLLFEKHSK